MVGWDYSPDLVHGLDDFRHEHVAGDEDHGCEAALVREIVPQPVRVQPLKEDLEIKFAALVCEMILRETRVREVISSYLVIEWINRHIG